MREDYFTLTRQEQKEHVTYDPQGTHELCA